MGEQIENGAWSLQLCLVLPLPHCGGLIVARGHNILSVRTERGVVNRIAMETQLHWIIDRKSFAPGPNQHRAILRSNDYVIAIRIKRRLEHMDDASGSSGSW